MHALLHHKHSRRTWFIMSYPFFFLMFFEEVIMGVKRQKNLFLLKGSQRQTCTNSQCGFCGCVAYQVPNRVTSFTDKNKEPHPCHVKSNWMPPVQANSSCVIMSIIFMTTLFYKALILQGEIWRWSLLGPKELRTDQSILARAYLYTVIINTQVQPLGISVFGYPGSFLFRYTEFWHHTVRI